MEPTTERSFVEIQNDAIGVLKTIFDPEIPVDIYELGLIYEIKVTASGDLTVMMTLTSPSCPVAGTLPGEVQDKLKGIAGVKEVKVELTFDPPWSQDLMSEEAKLELGFLSNSIHWTFYSQAELFNPIFSISPNSGHGNCLV